MDTPEHFASSAPAEAVSTNRTDLPGAPKPPDALPKRRMLIPGSPGSGRFGLSPKDAAATLEELRKLCTTPTDDTRQLEAIVQRLREAGYKAEMTQVLADTLLLPDVNPHVGALWMHRLVTSHSWGRSYPSQMDDLCRYGEVGRRAVIEFLAVAGRKRRRKLVRRAVRRHGTWLRSHALGKPAAARALLDAGCYRKVVAWTRDWRQAAQPDLQALFCRAFALRAMGKYKKAHEAANLALARPEAAAQFPFLNLWCAVEEALAGNTTAAWDRFKRIRPAGWDEDSLSLYYLTRGVIRVQQADQPSRKEAFRAARSRIEDWFRGKRMYRRDFTVRRYYRRCLNRMARDSGSWGHGLWAYWRSADCWRPLVPLLLVPGLQLFIPAYLLRWLTRRRVLQPH